jgi:hypothetical protein
VLGGDELLLGGEELLLLDQHVEHRAGAGQRLLLEAGERDLCRPPPAAANDPMGKSMTFSDDSARLL